MPDLVSTGKIRIAWATAIANINAPTVAELNAALRIDTVVTADGLNREFETAEVDTSAISSTFETASVGTRKPSNLGVVIKRQTGTDTVAAALTYQAAGYLVIRDNIDASTAWAAGQNVEVYPAQCKQGGKAQAINTVQRLTVGMTPTADPALSALVA